MAGRLYTNDDGEKLEKFKSMMGNLNTPDSEKLDAMMDALNSIDFERTKDSIDVPPEAENTLREFKAAYEYVFGKDAAVTVKYNKFTGSFGISAEAEGLTTDKCTRLVELIKLASAVQIVPKENSRLALRTVYSYGAELPEDIKGALRGVREQDRERGQA